MKATVLVDNIASRGFAGEWGLSIHIAYQDRKILLDTGASSLFLENAKQCGISIEDVDAAVLSHAHWDHANGMEPFFQNNEKACFYLRKESAENCYGKAFWIFKKYIGLPRGVSARYADRIRYVSGRSEILPGVTLLPHSTSGLERYGRRNDLYVKKNGRMQPDDFAHEQSLVLDAGDGLVVFNSCSHGGADNIIKEAEKAFPDKSIKALVGGFHLFLNTDEEVHALADRIRKTGIREIYTGHCTGQHAYDILKEELGDAAHQLSSGMVMEF